MRISRCYLIVGSLSALLGGIGATARADIVWTSGQNFISDGSDVVTAGSSVYAYNVGGSTSELVNGVNFLPALSNSSTSIFSDGNVSIQNIHSDSGFAAPSTVEAGSAYAALLDSAGNNAGASSPIVLTLNVTPGQHYEVVIWASDSRQGSIAEPSDEVLSDGADLHLFQRIPYNVTGGWGGTFTTGEFTAAAPTETITIASDTPIDNQTPFQMLNAFELRNITATPEPTSGILLAIGAIGLLRTRRSSN